jgi:hypothetical protein
MNAAVSSQTRSLSRRLALTNTRRVVVLGLAFGLLLFLGLQTGREFTSLFFQKVGTASSQSAGTPQAANGSALPGEANREFLQSKVGHLLFSQYASDNCRVMLFDNRTGTLVEAGEVVCGNGWVQTKDTVDQQRVRTLLNAFRK